MKGVRALSLSDCEEVLRINSESLPGVACLDRTELERLVAMPNEHLAIDGPEDRLVGYLLAFRGDASYDGEEFLRFVEMALESFIYIDQVAVDARFRRGRVASTLYGVLEWRAKRSLAAYLCCEINLNPPNPTSLAFHRNKGFNQTGNLKTADGRRVALMTKHLVNTETEARET
jgi:hypothetical protein